MTKWDSVCGILALAVPLFSCYLVLRPGSTISQAEIEAFLATEGSSLIQFPSAHLTAGCSNTEGACDAWQELWDLFDEFISHIDPEIMQNSSSITMLEHPVTKQYFDECIGKSRPLNVSFYRDFEKRRRAIYRRTGGKGGKGLKGQEALWALQKSFCDTKAVEILPELTIGDWRSLQPMGKLSLGGRADAKMRKQSTTIARRALGIWDVHTTVSRILGSVRSVLGFQEITEAYTSGIFWYPPGGVREWHTNRYNGGGAWRMYYVRLKKSQASPAASEHRKERPPLISSMHWFSDPEAGGKTPLPQRVDDSDRVINMFRLGNKAGARTRLPGSANKSAPQLWHCIASETAHRFSLGFALTDRAALKVLRRASAGLAVMES